MTSLLILVIVALLGIAIWQLTKIFDLTQNVSGNESCDSEIATDKDNNIQGYLMFGFLGFIYALTIFSIVKYGHFPLLANSASEHGKDVDNLMWISSSLKTLLKESINLLCSNNYTILITLFCFCK